MASTPLEIQHFKLQNTSKLIKKSMDRYRIPKSKSTQSCVYNHMPQRKIKQWS